MNNQQAAAAAAATTVTPSHFIAAALIVPAKCLFVSECLLTHCLVVCVPQSMPWQNHANAEHVNMKRISSISVDFKNNLKAELSRQQAATKSLIHFTVFQLFQ